MSIVQVLVATAVLSAATAGMAAIFSQMAKQNSKQIATNNFANLMYELEVILADPQNCQSAFTPATFNPSSTEPQSISSIQYSGRTFKVGATYGRVTITSLSWVAPFSAVTGGVYSANFQIQVQPTNLQLNGLTWTRKIPVAITLDANNNISGCYAEDEPGKNCLKLGGGSFLSGSCMLPLVGVNDLSADDTNMTTKSSPCTSPGRLFYNQSNNKLLVCDMTGHYVWDTYWTQPWGASAPTTPHNLGDPCQQTFTCPAGVNPSQATCNGSYDTNNNCQAMNCCPAPCTGTLYTDWTGTPMCCQTDQGASMYTFNPVNHEDRVNGQTIPGGVPNMWVGYTSGNPVDLSFLPQSYSGGGAAAGMLLDFLDLGTWSTSVFG